MNRFLIISILLSLLYNTSVSAQNDDNMKSWSIGPELQVYPTGLLPGVRIERYLDEKSSINFRAALQIIDHRDLGVQDDETGNGYGFSIAYRRFFKSQDSGLSLAFRNDFWWNKMDWTNESPASSGSTNITVIQPTVLFEYKIASSSSLSITPSLGFGYEWNVKTEGEETGQGAILLIGVFVGF